MFTYDDVEAAIERMSSRVITTDAILGYLGLTPTPHTKQFVGYAMKRLGFGRKQIREGRKRYYIYVLAQNSKPRPKLVKGFSVCSDPRFVSCVNR